MANEILNFKLEVNTSEGTAKIVGFGKAVEETAVKANNSAKKMGSAFDELNRHLSALKSVAATFGIEKL